MRSEVARGYAAALTAATENADPDDLDKAINKVFDKNQQDRTDTDGFKLGMNFGEWRCLWRMLSSTGRAVKSGEIRSVSMDANVSYKGFRNFSAKLGITDAQAKELFGSDYNPDSDGVAWNAALKTGSFKGTFPVGTAAAVHQ